MFIATKQPQGTIRSINTCGAWRASPRICAESSRSRFICGFHPTDAVDDSLRDVSAGALQLPIPSSEPTPEVVMVWNEDDEDDAEDLIYSDLEEDDDDPVDLEDLDEDFDFGDEDDDAPLSDDDDKPDGIQIDDDDDE